MISTVDETGVTDTELGLFKIALAKLTISEGIVAEKNRDCLFFGKTANSFLIFHRMKIEFSSCSH